MAAKTILDMKRARILEMYGFELLSPASTEAKAETESSLNWHGVGSYVTVCHPVRAGI